MSSTKLVVVLQGVREMSAVIFTVSGEWSRCNDAVLVFPVELVVFKFRCHHIKE